jgi:hypothetical protein
MKKLLPFLSFCLAAAMLLFTTGCARHYDSKYVRGYSSHPEVGTPAWVKWVDDRVDARYANNRRAEPATQEWYAIVDHYVLRSYDWDYYPTGAYRYHTYSGDSYDRTGERRGFGNERYTSDGERGYPDYRYRIGDERRHRSGSGYTSDRYASNRYYSDRSSANGYARDGRWVTGSRSNRDRPAYYRGDYSTGDTRDRYYGPARFGERDREDGRNRDNRSRYKVGSLAWKHAVTEALLSGRVPKPPPRSDPWDQPLAPTH